MKILFFSDTFGAPTTTFIYNPLISLAKKHDVKYVCTERKNAETFPFESVEVLPFKENRIIRRIKWLLEERGVYFSRRNAGFSGRLREIIREFAPDLIHCHFANEAFKLLDNYNDKKVPIVVSVHGYDVSAMLKNNFYVRRLRGMAQRKNISIIFTSQFMKKRLQGLGICPDNSAVLYNGIDTGYFKRESYAVKNGGFIFLQVSSFVEKKGHLFTLYAFKKLLEEYRLSFNPKLIFSGEDDCFSGIKALVSQLGLNGNVEFTGWINPKQVKELMENANCFLQHSVTAADGDQEGISTSIMEAMAMELPVISTRHAGIPELVEDGVNGYLVEERDIENYAKRMRDILKWGYLQVNRRKVIERFDLDEHLRRLEAYYHNLITNS